MTTTEVGDVPSTSPLPNTPITARLLGARRHAPDPSRWPRPPQHRPYACGSTSGHPTRCHRPATLVGAAREQVYRPGRAPDNGITACRGSSAVDGVRNRVDPLVCACVRRCLGSPTGSPSTRTGPSASERRRPIRPESPQLTAPLRPTANTWRNASHARGHWFKSSTVHCFPWSAGCRLGSPRSI